MNGPIRVIIMRIAATKGIGNEIPVPDDPALPGGQYPSAPASLRRRGSLTHHGVKHLLSPFRRLNSEPVLMP